MLIVPLLRRKNTENKIIEQKLFDTEYIPRYRQKMQLSGQTVATATKLPQQYAPILTAEWNYYESK